MARAFSKAGVWYLVARSGEELRSFRVERIRSVEESTQRFERPSGFDLERYWSESSARFSEASRGADCIVVLRARNDALERLRMYWPAEILSQGRRDALVRLTFPGTEVALFQLVAWSDVATLVDPPELREALVMRARRTLNRYER